MQNDFYFKLMLFSFSRCLDFCSDFFGHVGKRLDNKAKVQNWRPKLENK